MLHTQDWCRKIGRQLRENGPQCLWTASRRTDGDDAWPRWSGGRRRAGLKLVPGSGTSFLSPGERHHAGDDFDFAYQFLGDALFIRG